MSNFLKNLAKRGAGLPLATEYFPRPSTDVDARLGSRDTPPEIASESTGDFRIEALLPTRPQPAPVAATLATPEVQRSPVRATSTARPPSLQESATALSPLPSGPSPVSAKEIPSSLRPEPPHAIGIAPDPASDLAGRAVPRDEFNEDRGAAGANAVARTFQSKALDRDSQSARAESNLQEITWGRHEPTELMLPEAAAKSADTAVDGKAHDAREVSSTKQLIRPAATERQIPAQLPKITPASPGSPATIPIHVRIGRVEVRGAPAPAPATSAPKESTPLGFASYQRMRRYRS